MLLQGLRLWVSDVCRKTFEESIKNRSKTNAFWKADVEDTMVVKAAEKSAVSSKVSKNISKDPQNMKKRTTESSSDGDATDSGTESGDSWIHEDQGSEENLSDQSDVQVDFDFHDIKSTDYHSVRTFIRQLFSETEDIDISDLCNIIVGEDDRDAKHIPGSCIKTEDDLDTLFAFTTVADLKAHQKRDGVKQLETYLLSQCQSNDTKQLLKDYFSNEHVFWLLNERLMNMPMEVIAPSHKLLLDELQSHNILKKQGWILLISRTYEIVSGKSQKNKKNKSLKEEEDEKTCFYLPEDEVFFEYAKLHGDWKVKLPYDHASKWTFQNEGIVPGRRWMLIPASDLPKIVEAIQREYE